MSNYEDYFNDRNNAKHEEHKNSSKSKKETKKIIKNILKFLPKLIIPAILIVGLIIAGKFAYNLFFNNTVEYLFFEEGNTRMRSGTSQDISPVVISKNGTGFKASLVYSSSNPTVATVDENGVVTANTIGQTKIKVKDSLSAKEAELQLTVVADKVNLKGINMEKDTINIYLNQERFLGFSYNPDNTTERGITLTSSDPNKVSVSGKKIKGESYGSADIKVIGPNGDLLKTVKVNVIKDTITSLTVDQPNLMIKKGKKDTIKFSYQSSDNSTLVDEEIYAMSGEFISLSGKTVQAKKIGATDVYIKLGKQVQKFTINVIENDKEIKSIEIDAPETTLKVGGTTTLKVKYNPTDAEDTGVTWSSSDDSVATIDKNGNVKAIKAGAVTITATTKNNITQTVTITVQNKQTTGGMTPLFYCSGSSIQVGNAATISIYSTSLTTISKSVVGNTCTGIATVSAGAVVKGLAKGSCHVSFSMQMSDGQTYRVACPVTIY